MERGKHFLQENKKTVWSGITVFLLLILFALSVLKIRQDRVGEQIQSRIEKFPAEYAMYEMPDQVLLSQSFRPQYAKLDSLDLYLANIEEGESGYLDLTVRESEGKQLFHKQLPLTQIEAGDYFSVPVNLTLQTGEEYVVDMYTMGADTLVPMMLGLPAQKDVKDNTTLMLDYQESETGLIIGYTYSHLTYLGYEENETALVVKYRILAAAAELILCAAFLLLCIYKRPSRFGLAAAECLLVLLFFEAAFSYSIRNGAGEDERTTEYHIRPETDYMALTPQKGTLAQTFTSDLPLDGVAVTMQCEEGSVFRAIVQLKNTQTGEVICKKALTYDAARQAKQLVWFQFERYNADRENISYELTVEKTEGDAGLKIFGSEDNSYPNGNIRIDDIEQKGDLAFALLSESASPNVVKWTLVLFVFLFAVLVFSFWLLCVHRCSTPCYFAVLAALFGCVYLLILPPNSAPDAYSHTLSAYHYSNAVMGIRDDKASGMIHMREEDVFLQNFIGKEIGLTDYQKAAYFAGYQEKDGEISETKARSGITYMMLPYIPAVIGMTAARILGLNSMLLIYLGELFNLAVYIGLLYFAIRKIPFGKPAMAVMGLCPMVLHLAASFSYDPMQIGIAALYIAYCLDLAYGDKEKLEKKELLLPVILLVGLAFLKVVYLVLALLLLLIPAWKWKTVGEEARLTLQSGKRKKLIWAAAAILLLTAAVVGLTMFKWLFSGVLTGGNQVAVDGKLVTTYSVGQFFGSPLQMAAVFVNTLFHNLVYYVMTMFGAKLGWLNVDLQEWIIWGFLIVFFLAAAKGEQKKENVSKKHKNLILVSCLLTVFLVMLSMLLNFTFSGSPVVEGVQGRYFLPLLPLLPCLLANLKSIRVKVHRELLLHVTAVLEILAVVSVISVTLAR